MSLVPVNCPYCSTKNTVQIISRSVTNSLTAKLFGHEKTDTMPIPKYEIKCRLCLKYYEQIEVTDYTYIKSNFVPLSPMLIAFKTKFPTHNLNSLFDNALGLTRPKKTFGDRMFRRNPHLHVCFELDGKRAYIDCEQIKEKGKMGKTILRGLDVGV